MKDFIRVSAAVPPCHMGNFEETEKEIISLWEQAHKECSAVVVFPELCLAAYTMRDLFFDRTLLAGVYGVLRRLIEASRRLEPVCIVGLPVEAPQGLYNCAAAVQGGQLLGIVPKSYIPTYREFEERRWFRPGTEVPVRAVLDLNLGEGVVLAGVPFGTDIVFVSAACPSFGVGVEICEDMWVQMPPAMRAAGAGATVICNLSASNFTIGKADLRRNLALASSERGHCAYVYVAAGPGESSTDLAFDADAFVCENGAVLASGTRFERGPQLVSVDVDLELLTRERRVTNTYADCAVHEGFYDPARAYRRIGIAARFPPGPPRRAVAAHPFVPADAEVRATRCHETLMIQSNALATRMRAIGGGAPKLFLGLSGGLDSTHAALVCAVALDLLGLPRDRIECVTMPGLGTTAATKSNALDLAAALGARIRTAPIGESALSVLRDMGHPAAAGAATTEDLIAAIARDKGCGDVALENVQARLRTLLLMCLANREGGIVVGTGDLSEKALGWCTYSGDHIAMYDVNAGVPKTLIRCIVAWAAARMADKCADPRRPDTAPAALRKTLMAILDTPISPELLPPDPSGAIAQLSEDALGPYEVHDFILYHFVRHGRQPHTIIDLARAAFGDRYSVDDLKKYATIFVRRFFSNQFKRSCATDGPKVGSVALSPRGDWRMPSDASPSAWLRDIETYTPQW